MELSIVTGTQRRHQRDYVSTYEQVVSGSISEYPEVMYIGMAVNYGTATQMHHGRKWNI